MVKDWKIAPPAGRCAATGRTFAPGESYHVVLFYEDETFRREEYADEAWTGPPEGAFCCFRSKMPTDAPERKKRLLVDDDVLVDFFKRLDRAVDDVQVQFRFVLALLLMRKRRLRYEDSQEEGETEIWRMTLVREGTEHKVVNPHLNDHEIERVSAELTAVLHSDAREAIDDAADEAQAADDAA